MPTPDDIHCADVLLFLYSFDCIVYCHVNVTCDVLFCLPLLFAWLALT